MTFMSVHAVLRTHAPGTTSNLGSGAAPSLPFHTVDSPTFFPSLATVRRRESTSSRSASSLFMRFCVGASSKKQ